MHGSIGRSQTGLKRGAEWACGGETDARRGEAAQVWRCRARSTPRSGSSPLICKHVASHHLALTYWRCEVFAACECSEAEQKRWVRVLDRAVRRVVDHVGRCRCVGAGELRLVGSGGGEGVNGMGGGGGAMRAGDRWFRLALFPQQRDAANRPGRSTSGIRVCESGWLLSARGWDPAPPIG